MRAILRDEIVHPLRKHHFVRADRVLKFRELLEEISSMTGLTNEEKDPEEFMNILMAQTLKADPYLKVTINVLLMCVISLDLFLRMSTVQFRPGRFLLPAVCREER